MRPKQGISRAEQEFAVAKSSDSHFETKVALLVEVPTAEVIEALIGVSQAMIAVESVQRQYPG
jgi:hypothetical protein